MTQSSQSMTLSSQVRTNAAISYFFLGPLFLLAVHNPDLANPFIRSHARRASRFLALAIAYLVFHFWVVSGLFPIEIPVINITIDRLILLCLYALYFLTVIVSAYRAFQWSSAESGVFALDTKTSTDLWEVVQTETEQVRITTAFLPFFGWFVISDHPLARLWKKIGTLFLLVFITILSYSRGDVAAVSLLFGYIVVLVSTAVYLFAGKSPEFLRMFSWIPSKDEAMAFFRTLPRYASQVVQAVFGRTEHLDFKKDFNETLAKELQFESNLSQFFSGSKGPLSPYLIYVPMINLIFLPKFFAPGNSPLVIAVGQGIVLTVLVSLGAWFYGLNDPILLFGLAAMVLGFATVKDRPFYRIPVLYELSWLLSTLSFGLISGSRIAKVRSQEVKEVRLKVE